MERGAVYVAVGDRYRQEAADSAKSLKAQMPGLPVALFTDEEGDASALGPFDVVAEMDEVAGNRLDKIRHLDRAPFERALFLDTDTYVCAPLDDVFALLDRFDIALAHAARRTHEHYPPLPGVPDAFPEFNSGVIAFRNAPGAGAAFAAWADLYVRALGSAWYRRHRETRPFTLQDQHHLRKALYESDLRIATLPPEYNCRLMPGFVNGPVRVVHGRHSDLPAVARRLNSTSSRRLFVTSARSLYQVGARAEVLVPYFFALDRVKALRQRTRRLLRGAGAPAS
jgi:hypothetical protein